jgi:ADP-heptose:LPS heptosyltransferase/GT2 family glycosyltransferase
VPEKPKTLVYLRPDTIGDLVLFTSALQLFISEWPGARHVIVVRQGYESLEPLFPRALIWKVAHLNPFKQRPSACRSELADLLGELAALKPDLILAPTLNRTWLEIAVASHFKAVRSVVMGGADVDPIFAESLRIDLGVDPAAAFRETVASDAAVGDVENQHRFAEKLIGRSLPSDLPAVSIPDAAAAEARSVLAKLGLASGKWAAVFAGGLVNVAVKSWPADHFAELVAWLQTKRKIPVLLLAHESEASATEDVANRTVKHGGTRPGVWLGRDGELPLLAGLLADARLYVGHDTGAMHLAAAVGRPVVGVFGGGHWPRFRPSARQGVSVVQPLPCFGCNWDCHFGDGPCVKTIPAADVIRGAERVLAASDNPLDTVVESRALAPETVAFIKAATPGILELKSDRVKRQHKIEELKAETDLKDIEIDELKLAADERKREMESIKAELEQECADKDKEIEELKSETNSKDTEIADLKRAAEERKQEMESIKAELEQECADKDKEIEELKSETNSKDTEIEALKVTCNDREQIVMRLDAGLKAHIAAADAREKALAALEADRAVMSRRLEQLSALPPGAEAMAETIKHKDVHILNLEAIIRNRDGRVAGLEQAIANYASGYSGTEQAKHYGELLAKKEAVIQELNRACIERGAVIAQLAADATGPSAGLRKLWIGLKAGLRNRVTVPVGRWVFRRIVDDYWMQIGVLRQYEPRPIAWDKRLSTAPMVAADSLPRIGIVTPSYCQPAFLESTMLSILNQEYPKLLYVVQDGGSGDASPEIIKRYASRLTHWSSEPDKGQADAIRKGFAHIASELGPDDLMAWFNSDDLVAPRALAFVAGYFARNPDVDVIYGHRIIIDDADREVGRWIMPRHEEDSIEWIDYVPQETLFWRKRAWDLAGGIDPSFQFALDWDLLARFQQAGFRIVRLPYFLGCFRVHSQQKTSQVIHTTGADEMARIRLRFHGSDKDNGAMIERHARRIRFRGAVTARLMAAGIRR